jgi:hypothetical protein
MITTAATAIHRNARLVVLDMVVTDAKGNIVAELRGLTTP